MVENRPWANFFAHLTLMIGVAVVVFPVYVALVASTQAPGDLLRGTLPMLPGAHGIENLPACGSPACRTRAHRHPAPFC